MTSNVSACARLTLCFFTMLCIIRGYSKSDQWMYYETSNCTVVSEKNETILNCSNRGFFTLPRTYPINVTVFYMRSNFISSVPAGAFLKLKHLKHLDLSDNGAFLSFHQDSLMGLNSLQNLTLKNVTGISFGCQQGSSRLFRHTPCLQTLRMKKTLQFDTSCMNSTFRDLTKLRYLSVTWPTSPLPSGFSLLKQLDVLDLSGSTFKLTESNFHPLSCLNISRLALRQLHLQEFNKHALNPVLHSLKVLDFTCNNEFDSIGVKTNYFSPILECLENSTRLEVLIIDNCYDYDDAISLTAEQFVPLKRVPLKALSLRQNAITIIFPFLRHLKRLEYINLDYNMPMIFKDGDTIFRDLGMRRHLKEFHFSHQYLYSRVINVCNEDESEIFMRDFSNKVADKSRQGKLNINKITGTELQKKDEHGSDRLSKSELSDDEMVVKFWIPLETLSVVKIGAPITPIIVEGEIVHDINVSDFVTDGVRVQMKNNLKTLNISSNFLSYIDFVIYGLDSLTTFDISNNNLEYVPVMMFRAIGKLEHLFASRNRIGLVTNSQDLTATFSSLPNIRTIDLSLNQLSFIPEGMFSLCPHLERLNVQRNGMKSVNLKFANLQSLKFLDFSHNEINGFTKEQTIDLQHKTFALQMNNNSGFECSCNNVPFIEWIQLESSNDTVLNKENITCLYKDGREEAVISVDLGGLYVECIKESIIITVSTLISVVLCTALIAWRFQWHIRYWVYILRMKRRRDGLLDVSKNFDAFISYADVDYDLALSVLHKLEEMGLLAFFRDRNTDLGACVLDECFRGIESSRKSIVCLTESYLDSDQRYFELRMSMLRGKGFVIPVVVGDVALEKLSKPLRHLLSDDVYFEWPTLESEEKDFWKSMLKAVLTPKGICIRKNGAVIYYAD